MYLIDGYDGNFFHCNWGWGGTYDTWFLLSNLTPGTHYYNDDQYAVMDIHPTYYTNVPFQNTTIASGTYTSHTITVDNCTIQNNANVILKSNCAVEIFGPFTVPVGATLEVK